MLGTLVLGRLEVGELNKYLQQKRLSNTYNSISLWAQIKKEEPLFRIFDTFIAKENKEPLFWVIISLSASQNI